MAKKLLQTDVPEGMRLGMVKDSEGVRGLLFDDKTNKLVGHAELFEVDDDEDGEKPDPEPIDRDDEYDEWVDLLSQLLTAALIAGIEKAGPPIGRWMRTRAIPALRSAPARAKTKLSRPSKSKEAGTIDQIAPSETEASADGEQIGIATLGPTMTAAEARQRLTAAVMATAYAQEQMRLLHHAQILDDDEPLALGQALNELSPEGVQHVVRSILEDDPSMLGAGSLTAFVLALETGHLSSEPVPVRVHAPKGAD